jgi:hypothetical protein
LKNREDELRKTISELEAGAAELQNARLNGSLSQLAFQDNDTDNTNMILKAKFEEIISTSDVSIEQSNIASNHQSENNEIPNFSTKVESSSRKLIFDTRDLFR